MVRITINASKAIKKLAKANKRVPKAFQDVLFKVAALVEAEAVRLAPVDTGRLKDSIHIEVESKSKITISDGVFYGVFQELGSFRTPPQPFMLPAAQKAAKNVKALMKKALKKALK